MLGLSFRDWLRFWLTVIILRVFAWVNVLSTRLNRRRIGLVPLDVCIKPDRIIYVPSQYEKRRRLRVDVYEPPELARADKPWPVHINLHGSGFTIPLLGSDTEICYYLSRKLQCVVLDADYAKAPERPFPCALQDVLSVVAYARAQPHWLDRARVTLGGFSAGGNLALVASAALPAGAIRTVCAWYPPCDLRHGVRQALPPVDGDELPGAGPGHALSEAVIVDVFGRAYLQDGADPSDPRVNPMCCDPLRFPPVTVVVGTKDPLYPDCVAFHDKLKRAGRDVELLAVPRAKHVWERFCEKNTVFWDFRERAFGMTEQRIRQGHTGSVH